MGEYEDVCECAGRNPADGPCRKCTEEAETVCGACHGSGWAPRDPDIGTEQECSSCNRV